MGKINMGRVILGGLVAGLVINIGESILNIPLLGELWKGAMQALNRPPMEGVPVLLIVLGFAWGIFEVWLYAAIRPRFGAGPMTAICAGLVVWVLSSFFPSIATLEMQLFPRRMLFYTVLWEFFEMPIATLVGASIYKE